MGKGNEVGCIVFCPLAKWLIDVQIEPTTQYITFFWLVS